MAWGQLLLIVTIVGIIVKNCQANGGSGAPCSAPILTPQNFHKSIEILNTTNRTLFSEIHSDTPLKEAPSWRYENSSRFPTHIKHSVETGSCSTSPSTTCAVSNLTLINVIQGEYDGNYSLTAENVCDTGTVYVYVNIVVLPKCRSNYYSPPQLKIAPPQIVETVEGDKSVVISAQYEGVKDDPNLVVYWCVYFTEYNYYCYNSGDDDNQFVVTTDGCPPDHSKCCYYTVILTIRSLTLNLSGITLQSMVIWNFDPGNFIQGNSILVVNARPTLDKWSKNQCVELSKGRSTEFFCIYNASTDPNITVTTWRFNEELLEQNSSHYTMITHYGGIDPLHRNQVFSTLMISNVIPALNGTYTCQCEYNSTALINHKDNVVSRAASFCLKVIPGEKQESLMMIFIILLTLVVVGLIFIFFTFVLMFCCWWRKHKNLKTLPNQNRMPDESTALLSDNKQMSNFAVGSSINRRYKQQPRNISNSSSRDRSRSISPYEDTDPTNKVENKDTLISGQDARSSLKGLIPSHQRPYRQPGDMVTGATNTFGATVEEICEQSPAPAENSNHASTSLASFDRTQIGNNHTNQPATSECCVKDIEYGSDKAVPCNKPVISTLPTEQSIECEAEGPRTSIPAATIRPSVSEPVGPHPAERDAVLAERSSVEISKYHDKILNMIAPEFIAHVNMDSLLPFLQQHQLVTRIEIHHLSCMLYSSSEKAQKLLSYLKTKGADTLQRVLCCLNMENEHTGHRVVADKLKQLMQDCSIKYTDFCSNCRQSC